MTNAIGIEIWNGCEECEQGLVYNKTGKRGYRVCSCVKDQIRDYTLKNRFNISERAFQFNMNEMSQRRLDAAQELAEAEKTSAYITGKQGTGKTIFGTAILKKYYDVIEHRILRSMLVPCPQCREGSAGQECSECMNEMVILKRGPIVGFHHAAYITGYDVIAKTKRSFDEKGEIEILDIIRDVDLLVLDEFQAMLKSTYFTDQFFALVDYRYSGMKKTIYLSNIKMADLTNVDMRIYSRMQEGKYYDFGDRDFRQV